MSKPRVFATVVESTTRPGHLSLRFHPSDNSATPFYRAITENFEPGDTIALVLIRRAPKAKSEPNEPPPVL